MTEWKCKPRIFDCFMLFNELDMLECRLTELSGVVDKFVIVECGEDHRGNQKVRCFEPNSERFERWQKNIIHVWVPTLHEREPIARDREQREEFRRALWIAKPWDIIMQSDLDEIPSPNEVSKLEEHLWKVASRGENFIAFEQRLSCFAVDWLHPDLWPGTVAARHAHIRSFAAMRDSRATAPRIINGGRHLSWLGGPVRQLLKLKSFAHPEIEGQAPDISDGVNFREGRHVDGVKLLPVDVDDTYPEYIRSRRCPENWFRPRE